MYKIQYIKQTKYLQVISQKRIEQEEKYLENTSLEHRFSELANMEKYFWLRIGMTHLTKLPSRRYRRKNLER